jgi:hypothetical protein
MTHDICQWREPVVTHDICHRTRTKKPKFETSNNTIKSAYNGVSVGVFQMHFRVTPTACQILVQFYRTLFLYALHFLFCFYLWFCHYTLSHLCFFSAIFKEIHYTATQKYITRQHRNTLHGNTEIHYTATLKYHVKLTEIHIQADT